MALKPFILDERLAASCFLLGDWPLSQVLLKNHADYPWFILVPKVTSVQEIDELPEKARLILMKEISQLSSWVKVLFKPDKLNIGALGNVVSQLHIHVIARFKDDPLWPHGVWQAAQTPKPYEESAVEALLENLRGKVQEMQDLRAPIV